MKILSKKYLTVFNNFFVMEKRKRGLLKNWSRKKTRKDEKKKTQINSVFSGIASKC